MIVDRPNFMPQLVAGELPVGLEVTKLGLTEDVPNDAAFDVVYSRAYEAALNGAPAYSVAEGGRKVYSPVDGNEYVVRSLVHDAMRDACATLERVNNKELTAGNAPVLTREHYEPYLVTSPTALLDGMDERNAVGALLLTRAGAFAKDVLRDLAPDRRQIKRWATIGSLGIVLYGVATETSVVHDLKDGICTADTSASALDRIIGPIQDKVCGVSDAQDDPSDVYNLGNKPWQVYKPRPGDDLNSGVGLEHPALEPPDLTNSH